MGKKVSGDEFRESAAKMALKQKTWDAERPNRRRKKGRRQHESPPGGER